MVVLDTSALLFWTLDPARLSTKAERAIEQADRIVISSISVWEIALKVKRGKLEIPLTIPDYIERLQRLEALEILSVDVQPG
jgi:PIN domain nuclease of toxin-antitoxin system